MTYAQRVLVADDSPINRQLLQSLLGRMGLEVQAVEDGQSTLDAVAAQPPDLVLLDVMMPGMDGGTLAARLRESPSLESVPIVFLTAAVKKAEVITHQGQIGGFPFVAKPVEFDELLALLKVHCG